MNCPSCEVPLDSRGVDLDAGVVRCSDCGHVLALSMGGQAVWPQRLPAPPATRVVVDRSTPGRIVLRVPGAGGCALLGFVVFWLALTASFTVVPASGMPSGFTVGGLTWLIVPAVLVPFWLVALGMLVFGLFTRCGVTGIYLDGEQYPVTKQLWGKGWTRRGSTDEIRAIWLAEAYRRNDRPVSAITIVARGRKIQFGSFLCDEEKEWIRPELVAFMAAIGRPLPR